MTFNHINITDSTVGVVNTGTIERLGRLDVSIGMFQGKGQTELAAELKQFSEIVVKDPELSIGSKDAIAEHLEYLVSQAQLDEKDRRKPMAKSVMQGMAGLIQASAAAVTIWDKLGPLLAAAIGL